MIYVCASMSVYICVVGVCAYLLLDTCVCMPMSGYMCIMGVCVHKFVGYVFVCVHISDWRHVCVCAHISCLDTCVCVCMPMSGYVCVFGPGFPWW